jgi:hypothetical protein
MVKWLAVFLFSLVNIIAVGQTVENIRTRKDEGKIIIVYDLVDFESGDRAFVKVYSSLDNFENPLTNASGDIGYVAPGPNKRIDWVVPNEVIYNFESISYQFKSEVVIGWKILTPSGNGVKRGTVNNITWKGGKAEDNIKIKLVTPLQVSIDLEQQKNTGTYEWSTSKNLAVGKGYTLQITGSDNVPLVEKRFAVKRRITPLIYGVPVVGVLVLLISGGGGGSEGLPDAPLPN